MQSFRINVRLSAAIHSQLAATAKDRGFPSSSAFVRALLQQATLGESATLDAIASQAKVLDRLHNYLLRGLRDHQALFAYVDSLTKLLLTCLPEPAGEELQPAIAKAQQRHARLLRTVGRAMAEESKSMLQELSGNAEAQG